MGEDIEAAIAAATARAEDGTTGLIERLVERIGGASGARAVFGEPVERDGVTVIPVARVRWGFGAGAGTGPAASDATAGSETAGGSGGGGMAGSVPVGFIEIGPSGARFHTIMDPYPSPLLLIAIGIMVGMVLRALSKLLRG